MKYAIKYYYTPEEIADKVKEICAGVRPAHGYAGNDYEGARRVSDIAEMLHRLNQHENIDTNLRLQLADHEQFEAVYNILEWDNFHTENIAFALAFGDEWDVLGALQSVHYMGQSFAIYGKLDRVEFF